MLLFLLASTMQSSAQSDEGMWLLNDPPRKLLKEKYGFDLTDAWLERAQKASVRFNSGGSGSFVSADGLVATNHHIGADALQKLSPKDKDYYHDGYYARTPAEELKCPDLELNVLMSMQDVTDRVNAAVKPEMSPAQAFAARRAVMSEIEKESTEKTKLRSDVVTLYQGGLYHLYCYKKFTDIRLVFAPEHGIAAFGGDVDNFEYPRHGLDICFFRVYEDGTPIRSEHFFKWSDKGPAEGDLVFVTGHPGTTNRLETLAKLKHRRDVTLPYTIARLRAMEAALLQFSESSPQRRKIAAGDLHSAANSRKAFSGQYQGLLDPKIVQRKAADESKLVNLNGKDVSEPIAVIESVQKTLAAFEKEYALFERGDAFTSDLFPVARHLVRMSVELPKKNADRFREYRDSNLDSLKFQLLSPAPVHPELERVKLTTALTFLAERLGGADPMVMKVLDGKTPTARAGELVAGTKLYDVAERKRLLDGGAKAIETSDDALIQLARLIDGDARALRKRYEEQVEEVERQAYAKLAAVRFKTFGRDVAPDATFTLRLAFGVVKPYEVDDEDLPFQTTFASAYQRGEQMQNREPFNLPSRWLSGKGKLDLATPFDFVSTADTIGGNSGSPVLNRAGELIGVNFDRNRHGLVRNFVYTDVQARHIAVHCRAVLEAIRALYDADPLLQELKTGRRADAATKGNP
jgi:hypothetical protein